MSRADSDDRKHSSSIPGDTGPAGRKPANGNAKDVQPGTHRTGTSWQSRRPDPDDKDDELNQALKDSFPASDPPESTQPGVTGWDLTDEEKKKQKRPA